MGAKPIQPSFTGGELSPTLFGRVDLERWGTSLKTCRNFIVQADGGVVNRTGSYFVDETKDSNRVFRLLPFVVGEDVSYVIELGHLYMRFYANGALLRVAGVPVEVASPYTEDDIWDVKHTQSADVMTLTHPDYQQRQLRRLTVTSFELGLYEARNGPFQPLNANEAIVMSASATTGIVTLDASSAVFNANMVDALVYLEQKELREVKPWVPDERGVTVGTLRRSDGKTYRCTSVPSLSGLAGTPWYQTGNVRPSHDKGRAFDGPQDARTDGTNGYRVGVEWEFLDYGYGVVRITQYNSPTQVIGVVTLQLPVSVTGGLGSPGTTWTLSGDGVDKTFTIAGASSTVKTDYSVTIAGQAVQSDPYYDPGVGIGGTPGRGDRGPTYVP